MRVGAALALFARASQLWLQHHGSASAQRRNGSLYCGASVGAAGYARHTGSVSGKAQWLMAYLTGNVNILESKKAITSHFPAHDMTNSIASMHCKHASLICSWFQCWGTDGLTIFVIIKFADLFSSAQASPNIAPQAQTIWFRNFWAICPKGICGAHGLAGFA